MNDCIRGCGTFDSMIGKLLSLLNVAAGTEWWMIDEMRDHPAQHAQKEYEIGNLNHSHTHQDFRGCLQTSPE
jgi:hypothetical protein